MFFADILVEIGRFMDSGGMVLWAIVILLFVMWTLLFERIWYFRSVLQQDIRAAHDAWTNCVGCKSKYANQIREKLISEVNIKIDENIMMIKTLVAVAPLFGLLGTVTGMIVVFDVMAFTGGGDAKAMAGGVSQATVPTMSGMVAALSGVFGLTYVERKAEHEKNLLQGYLTMNH
jgi:biopolymer transport protein ExbB